MESDGDSTGDITAEITGLRETVTSPLRRVAVPGMRMVDGTYVPAKVPPQWEAYDPCPSQHPSSPHLHSILSPSATFVLLLIHFYIYKTSFDDSEQSTLSKQVLQSNHLTFSPDPPFPGLKHIAGVDISFLKNTNRACAMLSILNFPELTLEYQTYDIVEMTEEYIPFYLAFREVKHLVRLFERCKKERGDCFPQIVFVDGGGVWHPKGTVPSHASCRITCLEESCYITLFPSPPSHLYLFPRFPFPPLPLHPLHPYIIPD